VTTIADMPEQHTWESETRPLSTDVAGVDDEHRRDFVPRPETEDHVTSTLSQVRRGGDEGNRTLNPRLAKAVLCQLSYVP
jgi:hypothetical protein